MTRTLLHYIVLFLLVVGSAGVVEAFGTEAYGAQPASGKKPNSGSTRSEKMIILGDVDQNGVKALAHLKEEGKAMAGLGGNATHHLMVVFVDQGTGELIESRSATVKYSYENQKPSAAIPLTAMQGHYGADLNLEGPGEYQFIIGSQFADDRKRQFRFDFTLR